MSTALAEHKRKKEKKKLTAATVESLQDKVSLKDRPANLFQCKREWTNHYYKEKKMATEEDKKRIGLKNIRNLTGKKWRCVF